MYRLRDTLCDGSSGLTEETLFPPFVENRGGRSRLVAERSANTAATVSAAKARARRAACTAARAGASATPASVWRVSWSVQNRTSATLTSRSASDTSTAHRIGARYCDSNEDTA